MFEFNFPIARIPDDYREFLPTMTTPAIDDLLVDYDKGESEMRRLHGELMGKENRHVLEDFAYGAEVYHKSQSKSHFWALDLIKMFDLPRAINARTEHFWFKLFDMCSLTSILPSTLWTQWRDSFMAWRECSKGVTNSVGIPPFERSTVYGSLSLIEAHRANFFSMRVDSLWTGLSGMHKTNWGSGFHKRFILNAMYSELGNTTEKDRTFYDLINICNTIMSGTEDPFYDSNAMLRRARDKHCGEWVEVKEGCLRIRAYQVGTLHVEVHPEIANRLNIALAYMHPNALPDELTLKRPRRKAGFGSAELIKSTVAPQVRSYLRGCNHRQREDGLWMLTPAHAHYIVDRLGGAVRRMIDDVLSQVGGVRDENIHLFDYPPVEVVAEIVLTGEVPEKVSHQFYCTPTDLAKEFVEWAGVEEQGIYYESSAGTGGIAKHMPLQTFCVEVDRLRAMALDKMGFEVKQADFLSLSAADLGGEVDGVLMNPPFAGGAWQAHFEHAIQFVRMGGSISAILPEGAPRKMPTLLGLEVMYSEPKKNRFPDTTISVVFAKWVRATASATSSQEGTRQREGQLALFEAA